jgi:hypothetical protein
MFGLEEEKLRFHDVWTLVVCLVIITTRTTRHARVFHDP